MVNPRKFFGGDASDLGNVRRLAPASFKEFVDQLLAPVSVNLTHEQFAKLPKEERQRAKRVPYVVPCSFDGDTSARHADLARGVSLLCLDVDDPVQARPLMDHPDLVALQLAGFNFALHTTASSTFEAPRLRVFVEAQDVPVESYADAVRDVAARLGLPAVTRESLTVVQPMYRPVAFRGDQKHPLVASAVDGRPYSRRDLKEAAAPVQPQEDALGETLTDAEEEVFRALDYLRSPVAEVTLADVKSALSRIDPDISYPEWLEVAAAMRHQFPGEAADAAYELFDEWSAGGTKYVSSDDTAAKWKSLRPTPFGRKPVTVRSLLKRAVAAGWDSGRLKARCYKSALDWIKAHAGDKDATLLVIEGVKQIAAAPLLTSSEEEGLLQELARALKASGLRTGISSLRKDLRRLRQAERVKDKGGRNTPDWAKGWCYISSMNVFLRPIISEQLSPEALDNAYGQFLLPSEEESREGDGSLCAGAIPVVRPRDYLLNTLKIQRAYDKVYDPTQFNDTFVQRGGKTYVNTYIRTHPEPDPLFEKEAGEVFTRHVNNLIAEPEYARTLTDFMAFIVQHPGVKIRWAVLVQGAEGCGKSVLANILKNIIGQEHVAIVNNDAVARGWNEWADGHQLVAFEEIRASGRNRHELMDRLKELITNDQVCINQRGVDTRTVNNCANYMLFTNHQDALALTEGDRRYFVLKSPLQRKKDVLAKLGGTYFRDLFQAIDQLRGGMRAWFEHYRISPDFDPNGHAPATTYRDEMVVDSTNDTVLNVRETMGDSDNPLVRPDILSSTVLSQLLENAGLACERQHLGRILRDEGLMRADRCAIGGVRHQVWFRPGGDMTAEKARSEFLRRSVEGLLGDTEEALG